MKGIYRTAMCLSVFASISIAKAEIPVDSYPQLIVGRWEIRTYGNTFRADGVCYLFNPDNDEILDTGTWSIKGTRLSMNWQDLGKQNVGVKFLSKDSWEWQSTPERIWEATRLDRGPL